MKQQTPPEPQETPDSWQNDYDNENLVKDEQETAQEKRGTNPDYKIWSVKKENTPLADIPLIRCAGDAVGLESKNQVLQKSEELAQVVDLAVGILKSTDEAEVYKFLRHQMRYSQQGSYGHSLKSLTLHLQELAEELTS